MGSGRSGGREVVTGPLPAVACVKLGVNEPRFMDMDRRRAPGEVTIWGVADLAVDEEWIGFRGHRRW